MISSVQNIQTTLINAPDNVLGMVKGVSELVLLGNESNYNNNNHKSASSPTSSAAPSSIMSPMSNSSSSLLSSSTSARASTNSSSGGTAGDIQRAKYHSLQSHSTIVMPAGVLNSSTPKSQSVSGGGGGVQGKELIDRTVLNDDDMVSYCLEFEDLGDYFSIVFGTLDTILFFSKQSIQLLRLLFCFDDFYSVFRRSALQIGLFW